jgi:hypothetical protein
VALGLGGIGATSADAQPSLVLTTGADPAESIVTQIIANGASTNSENQLSVTVKAAGGQGCGANYAADGGAGVIDAQTVSEVAFTSSINHEFRTAGAYLLCGWLNDAGQSGDPVIATASLLFTVRAPHLALSLAAPATVAVGQTFQIATTAQAEVSRSFTEYIGPNTGRGCPANASAAETSSGESLIGFAAHGDSWYVEGGPFTESANVVLNTAGQYLVCAYAEYPDGDSPPEIAADAPVTAIAPPPPCVVPAFTTLSTLGAVERSITGGNCTVGRIRRVASRSVRAGYVIALNHVPGTKLAAGTPVAITVSTGPPCIVPRVAAGTALGTVERRLAANHCSVGRISTARSRRYRRGRVLRLGQRTGQVLASHSAVAIVLARRR